MNDFSLWANNNQMAWIMKIAKHLQEAPNFRRPVSRVPPPEHDISKQQFLINHLKFTIPGFPNLTLGQFILPDDNFGKSKNGAISSESSIPQAGFSHGGLNSFFSPVMCPPCVPMWRKAARGIQKAPAEGHNVCDLELEERLHVCGLQRATHALINMWPITPAFLSLSQLSATPGPSTIVT